MEKVNFGVVGLGNIANTFCGDLVKSDKAQLYAVASRSIEKAEKFAKKYNAQKYYDDYLKLADDSEVDVIYIASPHMAHKEIAVNCMSKGKSVLCEKPAGVNEAELTEMINCAKENDVFFMEGIWTRCFPLSHKLREIVNSKELGKAGHIEANFGFGTWDDENIGNENHRLFSPKLAGGAILDLGVYCVQMTTWLKDNMPDEILTTAHKTPLGVDGNTISMFSYKDKTTAMLQCSICLNTSIDARIYFEKGRIDMERFISPNNMKITYDDGRIKTFNDDFEERGFHGFIYEIDHVADCISKGLKESPYHGWEDALKVVRLMDKMREQIDLVYPFE